MNSGLLKILTTALATLMVGCGSSDSSTEAVMLDAGTSTLLRLKEVTITSVGMPDVTITIDYTNEGNILRQTFRTNEDITRIRTFQTTTDGLLVRRSEDIDLDGIEDFVTQYVYNSSANLSRIERLGSTGLIDIVDIYAFQNGLAISRETRDIDDVVTSQTVDIASGSLVSLRTFDYEEGRVRTINIDSVGNGVFDRREDYSYNPNGTLATTSLNSVIDGVIGANSFVYEQGACNLWGDTTAAYFCVNPI